MGKNLFKGLGLILIAIGVLCFMGAQLHAATYTLVKTINLSSLIGDAGSLEVDVVGDELYVANYTLDKYFRIDPVTSTVLSSFSLAGGFILIDNHGSEYNPATGRILHASDRDAGGDFGYDAYFETDTNGVLTKGPFPLFGPEYISYDPEGLTVDPINMVARGLIRSRRQMARIGRGPHGRRDVAPGPDV